MSGTLFGLTGQFGGERRSARAAYRRFVAEGVAAPSPWAAVAAAAGAPGPEVPRRQRHPLGPPLDALRERTPPRGDWMARAYRDHGYTMREIAIHAGLHYSSVSRIIMAWEAGRNATFKA